METIVLKPLLHNKENYIAIYFGNDKLLNNLLKKLTSAKWSRSNKCWYIPCAKKDYQTFANAIHGKAILQKDEIASYLQQRKEKVVQKNITSNSQLLLTSKPIVTKTNNSKPITTISEYNQKQLHLFLQQLQLKAYSSSTIRTYKNEFCCFLQAIKNTKADSLETERIKDYLQYCHLTLKLTENTIHSRMNALKFYYEQVLQKEKLFWEIPRPKKQIQIPNFFNQDEIAQILKNTINVKHKTMLMLAYATGMRVSEVIHLKVYNIDSSRMQIKIEQAKGKKDRMISLSPTLLVMLREYFIAYKPSKTGYLFYGTEKTEPYSARSFQMVIQAAKERAGILKSGSTHALRHSFATHLLDHGTDVTMIMKLLGHNDLKTTLRYLHVSNRDILKIISPLDNLKLS